MTSLVIIPLGLPHRMILTFVIQEMDMDGIAEDPQFWEYVPSEDEHEVSPVSLFGARY